MNFMLIYTTGHRRGRVQRYKGVIYEKKEEFKNSRSAQNKDR